MDVKMDEEMRKLKEQVRVFYKLMNEALGRMDDRDADLAWNTLTQQELDVIEEYERTKNG